MPQHRVANGLLDGDTPAAAGPRGVCRGLRSFPNDHSEAWLAAPLHRRWQRQTVANSTEKAGRKGSGSGEGKQRGPPQGERRCDRCRVATGAARARDRASSSGDIDCHVRVRGKGLSALGDPQSCRSSGSRQGRHQGCIDGELHAAPQRQAVSNDFNAPFVLPRRGTTLRSRTRT